jgi:hypothetical protein
VRLTEAAIEDARRRALPALYLLDHRRGLLSRFGFEQSSATRCRPRCTRRPSSAVLPGDGDRDVPAADAADGVRRAITIVAHPMTRLIIPSIIVLAVSTVAGQTPGAPPPKWPGRRSRPERFRWGVFPPTAGATPTKCPGTP